MRSALPVACFSVICLICTFLLTETDSFAAPQRIICVEDVWCNLVRQIGGQDVTTQSLISSNAVDSHHLQMTPSIARLLSTADLVMATGAGYDDWAVSPLTGQTSLIIAADYTDFRSGQDPHLFFDFDIVNSAIQAFAQWLEQKKPEEKPFIEQRLGEFEKSLLSLKQKRQALQPYTKSVHIAVTEPAGGRLLDALGMSVIDRPWAFSVMSGNGSTALQTGLLEKNIETGKIRFLVVNPSVENNMIRQIRMLVQKHHIPIVNIEENLPENLSWQGWMARILDDISKIVKPDHIATTSRNP